MARGTGGMSAEIQGPRIVLLLSTLALTLIGFVMIYSASTVSALVEDSSAASYLFDQIKFAVLGFIVAAVIVRFFPYDTWTGVVLWGYWGICLLMLLLTAVVGTSALGAQRWLVLGPISLQPSEFAKIAIVIMLAKLLADRRSGALGETQFLKMCVLVVVLPTGLILLTQSDLGTTLIIGVGLVAVLFLGEVDMRGILVVIGVCFLLALFSTVFSSYRSNRWLFINPWNDGNNGNGLGYQLVHSYYAFSEGGIFGSGLGNSREKYLYLPESETDFIFSIIGEELGMVGALLVVALFLAFLWAGLRIARYAADSFGTMVAGSLAAMIVAQAFLNIGCVIGILPTTGKPLPFISSGGSSLIATFMMVALILSVSNESSSSVYQHRRDNLRVVRADGDDRGEWEADGRRSSRSHSRGNVVSVDPRRDDGMRSGRAGGFDGGSAGDRRTRADARTRTKRSSLVDGFPSGDTRWR
jgi:cell division protein FtsW